MFHFPEPPRSFRPHSLTQPLSLSLTFNPCYAFSFFFLTRSFFYLDISRSIDEEQSSGVFFSLILGNHLSLIVRTKEKTKTFLLINTATFAVLFGCKFYIYIYIYIIYLLGLIIWLILAWFQGELMKNEQSSESNTVRRQSSWGCSFERS